MSGFITIIALFPNRGANLTVVVAPSLATIGTNASVLILLRYGCVPSEVFTSWLVIRVAIACLEIVDSINRNSGYIQILIYFPLVLCPHFHLYCDLECLCR